MAEVAGGEEPFAEDDNGVHHHGRDDDANTNDEDRVTIVSIQVICDSGGDRDIENEPGHGSRPVCCLVITADNGDCVKCSAPLKWRKMYWHQYLYCCRCCCRICLCSGDCARCQAYLDVRKKSW